MNLPGPDAAAVSSHFFARVYPRISHAAEQRGGPEHHRSLLAGLHGRVIEVGSGHGLNFPYSARSQISEQAKLDAARDPAHPRHGQRKLIRAGHSQQLWEHELAIPPRGYTERQG